MSLTLEIDAKRGGARVVDTDEGEVTPPISLLASIPITRYSVQRYTIADATTDQSVTFGSGITAALALIIRSDEPITFKANGSSTATPCDPIAILTSETNGLITSLTISNASGDTATVEILIVE